MTRRSLFAAVAGLVGAKAPMPVSESPRFHVAQTAFNLNYFGLTSRDFIVPPGCAHIFNIKPPDPSSILMDAKFHDEFDDPV